MNILKNKKIRIIAVASCGVLAVSVLTVFMVMTRSNEEKNDSQVANNISETYASKANGLQRKRVNGS